MEIWDDNGGDYKYPSKDHLVNRYTDLISIDSVKPGSNRQSSIEKDISSSSEQHTLFKYSIR